MRRRFYNWTACGLIVLLIASSSAVVGDAKPLDLDAELASAMRAWLEKATPGPASFVNTEALRAEYAKAFQEGAAVFIKGGPLPVVEFDANDLSKSARAYGRNGGWAQARNTESDLYVGMIDRLKKTPSLRIGRATDVLAHALEHDGARICITGLTQEEIKELMSVPRDHAQLLLDRGLDPNTASARERGARPLHLAAQWHRHDVVVELLKRGAKPNDRDGSGRTPLHYARLLESAKLLLKHGADPRLADNQGLTPLHRRCIEAPFESGLDVIALHLEHKADVHAKDKAGNTPLHLADAAEAAALLIKHGAKVDAANLAGDTPLHLVSNAEAAALLIKHGAKVDAVNLAGDTPLHQADDAVLAEMLLKAGAEVNAVNAAGETPLFLAQDAQIIDVLVKHGANVNAVNKAGDTMLHRVSGPHLIGALLRHKARSDISNKAGKRAADQPAVQNVMRYAKEMGDYPNEVYVRVMLKLEEAVPVNFQKNKLVNVLDYYRNTTGINFYIDWQGMAVEQDTPVTLAMNEAPAGLSLAAVLEQVGKGKLTWRVDPHGIVLITTPERLKSLAPAKRPAADPKAPAAGANAEPSKLDDPIPVNFEVNKLVNVLEYIQNASGVTVRADWTALKKAGVDEDTPITLQMNSIPACRVAELVMHSIAGGRAAVKIHKDAVYISTPEGIEAFVAGAK